MYPISGPLNVVVATVVDNSLPLQESIIPFDKHACSQIDDGVLPGSCICCQAMCTKCVSSRTGILAAGYVAEWYDYLCAVSIEGGTFLYLKVLHTSHIVKVVSANRQTAISTFNCTNQDGMDRPWPIWRSVDGNEHSKRHQRCVSLMCVWNSFVDSAQPYHLGSQCQCHVMILKRW